MCIALSKVSKQVLINLSATCHSLRMLALPLLVEQREAAHLVLRRNELMRAMSF